MWASHQHKDSSGTFQNFRRNTPLLQHYCANSSFFSSSLLPSSTLLFMASGALFKKRITGGGLMPCSDRQEQVPLSFRQKTYNIIQKYRVCNGFTWKTSSQSFDPTFGRNQQICEMLCLDFLPTHKQCTNLF